MVLGELDSNMHKIETRPLSDTIDKNKLKMDKGPECETGNHQNPKGESREKPSLTSAAAISYLTHPQGKGIKGKSELLGPHQDKKLLHCKGNNQKN